MARIKGGVTTRKRHKNLNWPGYYGAKSKLYRTANQAVMKLLFTPSDRKRKT